MIAEENKIIRTRIDYPLFITVILLTCLGLVMVFSSSAVLAQEKYGSSLFFLRKTVLHLLLGFSLMLLFLKIPYLKWKYFAYPIMGICLFLILLTQYSGLGVVASGAKRWLDIGVATIQPSEFAKIGLLFFMAYSLEKKREKMSKFSVGVAPHLALSGVLIFFVLQGRDLGSAFLLGAFVILMLFLGGAKIRHLLGVTFMTIPFLYHLVAQEGYRMKRILTFLNPWDDRFGAGFQIIQSLLAFSEGGLLGKGLGAGQQKLFYLPEAHTDFIFSVLGEELGLVGALATISAFLFLTFRGLHIAKKAPDLFGHYLAVGVVVLIGLQSLLNMGVVMGLLPTKGLVLPFVGYGGSALVTSLVAIGILLNVSTYQRDKATSV